MDGDILHPLVSLRYERLLSLKNLKKIEKQPENQTMVALGDKLFIGGNLPKIYIVHWKAPMNVEPVTFDTPVSDYALAVYRSRLIIAGGLHAGEVTNKLWTSSDGVLWESSSLPPMPTKRASASAFDPGSPECLVVAGGRTVESGVAEMSVVEVLMHGQWSAVRSLPQACCSMHATIHNGNLYLTKHHFVLGCKLETLLAD